MAYWTNKYQSKIEELSSHLIAQELAFGFCEKQRTTEAKLVFTKAFNCLVTEALAANIGNSTGSFLLVETETVTQKKTPIEPSLLLRVEL